ncbi:MAG: ABC transporter substrate-binding protein [Thermoanaerobaculales bacterium]
MLRRVSLVVSSLLGLTVVMAGCGSKPVVGILLPTTGAAASYGEAIESGIRLALSEARDRQELPAELEIVWADTGSDNAQAIAELRRMVDERGVKMIIGGATSAEASALLPGLDELNIICVSPSASAPGLAQRSRMFFRIYPSDELEGYTAGKFLYEKLRQHRIVLFVGDTEYTRGIEPEFRKQYEEAAGGEIVERIDITEEDWRQRAAPALARTDAVYIIGFAEEVLDVLNLLQETQFSGRVVTTSAFYSTRVILEAGDVAQGVLFPLAPFDRTAEKPAELVDFVNRYMDTYQRAPDVFAAHGYDAMRLTLRALAIAKPPETTEIFKALHYGVSELKGVTGPILFDDYGDVKHYPKMFIIDNGQILTYSRYLKIKRHQIMTEVQALLNLEGEPTPTPTARR